MKLKRIMEAASDKSVNDFWWRSFNNGKAKLGNNLSIGREIEVKAMDLMSSYFEGVTEDGKSSCKIADYENDAVIQSTGIDFIAGHGIYNVTKRCYVYSKKYMVSVKKLAEKPNGFVWKGNDAIYISKSIWEDQNDCSSNMIVGNGSEYYLIDTNRYKRFPELLANSTRPNYVKIKINRGLEDGDILDLINDKYIK